MKRRVRDQYNAGALIWKPEIVVKHVDHHRVLMWRNWLFLPQINSEYLRNLPRAERELLALHLMKRVQSAGRSDLCHHEVVVPLTKDTLVLGCLQKLQARPRGLEVLIVVAKLRFAACLLARLQLV